VLLSKLDAQDQGVVAAAIDALAGPGDHIEIEALRRIVIRPDPTWRWAQSAAAKRLTQIGGPDAASALDQRYLNPANPPWRDDSDWLRRNGAKMIPILIEKLTDPAWQFEAAYALGELRATQAVGSLCDALSRAGYGLPHVEALAKIGSPDAVPALLDQTRHTSHDIRDHALRALDRIGDSRVVDAAIAACDDPHPVVRDRAARVLARHGDERALPQLIRLCDGPHAPRVAEALVRCADQRALPTLWHLFRTAPDRKTRHAAGRALARIEGRREYVHDPDLRVRRAYVWLLGYKPQWKPADELKRAVADDDPIVRARAAEALARLGEPAIPEQIRRLLDDPDPRVRATAATALGRLDGHQGRSWLVAHTTDPHPKVRAAVTAALHRIEQSRVGARP
jgi:HEAT repeat protein